MLQNCRILYIVKYPHTYNYARMHNADIENTLTQNVILQVDLKALKAALTTANKNIKDTTDTMTMAKAKI